MVKIKTFVGTEQQRIGLGVAVKQSSICNDVGCVIKFRAELMAVS